MDSPTDLN